MKKLLFANVLLCATLLQGQTHQWSARLDSLKSTVFDLSMDKKGNVYAAKTIKVLNTGEGDVVLYKHKPSGVLDWKFNLGGSAKVTAITEFQGSLLFAGYYRDSVFMGGVSFTSAGPFDKYLFIGALDITGNLTWAVEPFSSNREPIRIKVRNNLLYMASIGTGFSPRLTSFDLSGNLVREENFSGQMTTISDLEFDASGNLYLVGNANQTATIGTIPVPTVTPTSSYTTVLVQLNPQWDPQWVRSGAHVTFDFASRIHLINDTIFYTHGRTRNRPNVVPYLMKYDTQGNMLDSVSFNDAYSTVFQVGKTRIQGEDCFVLVNMKSAFIGAPVRFLNKDLVVQRQDTLSRVNAYDLRFAASDSAYAMSVTGVDTITYNGKKVLDIRSVNNSRSSGIIYFADSTSTTTPNDTNKVELSEAQLLRLAVYPNPARNQVFVEHLGDTKQAPEVYNMAGVLQAVPMHKEARHFVLDVSGLASGTYVIKRVGDTERRLIVIGE